jgi:predicted amidophosphoribosyltransferase
VEKQADSKDYCPYCGKKLYDYKWFCPHCGKKLPYSLSELDTAFNKRFCSVWTRFGKIFKNHKRNPFMGERKP